MTTGRYPPLALDALREIFNIGAHHAARALGELLQVTVRISVPTLREVDFAEVDALVGGEEPRVGAYLRFQGDLEGSLFFLLSPRDARALARRMTMLLAGSTEVRTDRANGKEGDFTELEWSALAEIGNILAGNFVATLFSFTSLEMRMSVPGLAYDYALAILAEGMLAVGESADEILLGDARLSAGEQEIRGELVFLPHPRSVDVLLAALAVDGK
ncbi:chemotaxis protein CheC [Brockia lithotrophica]|uniref:Chemotaxis protein CheC n=1 Tax=Brockia lithotrophica TaxID=933949 RepID=A0A660KZU7_9BACL|nr:chemotaxis protein CheC [Brockia lithotrophica]RKQ84212.1 chemotaxis protein CheC [Brockia lithotrophica]